MYQRKPRRFRRYSNGRGRQFSAGDGQARLRFNSYTNGHINNRFNTTQNAEKLFEKYSTLAKEALSSGDKTLSENYNQNKIQANDKPVKSESTVIKSNSTSQDLSIKEKKE